jgi:hypothetical protein
MIYQIQCTFNIEVEADDEESAFAEASDVFLFNEGHSDAVIRSEDEYYMEVLFQYEVSEKYRSKDNE